jgi:hypothetical protein
VVRGAQIVRVSHLEFGDLTPAEAREMDRQIMRAYDVIGQVTRQGVIGGSLSPIVVAGLVLWTVEPVVITTIKAVLA